MQDEVWSGQSQMMSQSQRASQPSRVSRSASQPSHSVRMKVLHNQEQKRTNQQYLVIIIDQTTEYIFVAANISIIYMRMNIKYVPDDSLLKNKKTKINQIKYLPKIN